MNQSIPSRASRKEARKPAKPHKDFALFPHASGRWAKKVRQKLYYFGRTDADPKGDAALKLWIDNKDDILAGKIAGSTINAAVLASRVATEGLTVEDLCDYFLNAKKPRIESGELAKRTYDEYHSTGERLLQVFGKTQLVEQLKPNDFELLRARIAKKWGPVRLGNEIQRVRSVFKYGYDAGHIDKPVRFGPFFKRPTRKSLRVERAKKGPRMFEAEDIRAVLKIAGVQMRAMTLLAINCGFGNNDCAQLTFSTIDLKSGWVNFPRPKTGVERRCPLWPETIEAVKAAIATRYEPKNTEDKNLIFITKRKLCWSRDTEANPVSKEFRKLLNTLDIHRAGLGFYALRHTFETIGGDSRDQVAVNHIMGHVDATMAGAYRERISDERLKAVTDHIYAWLFPPALPPTEKPAKKATAKKGGAK